ncbi:MAG: fused MFS/spermidine synthase [Sandaracinaceae bacterium]|nr:fused MFS/spermidine synthase [Sandaracinaceae bacterium]
MRGPGGGLLLFAALLLVSGAAALVYELAWARWLTLTLGASAEGLAIVTSSTMVGFALGAVVVSPRIDGLARPLRAYGLLEIAIGLSAALVSLLLAHAPTASLTATWPKPLVVVGLVALVSIPTALMGGTLPAVVSAVGGRDEARTRAGLSRLYAANTAGAVLGTIGMGFVLVEQLGYARAAAVGALANVGVGVLALVIERRAPLPSRDDAASPASATPAEPPAEATPAEPPASTSPAAYPLEAGIAAAASGFAVLAHEVLSSRLLVYGLFATAHAIAIVLAVYLLGLAIGACLVAGPLARGEVRPYHLGVALLGASAVTLAFVPSLGEVSSIVALLRGRHVEYAARIGVEVVVAATLLLPSATAMGTVFPLAAALGVRPGRAGHDLGRSVVVNTLAGALGSLGAAYALVPLLGVRGAIVIVTVLQAIAGAIVLLRTAPAHRAAGLGVALALGLVGSAWLGRPVLGQPPGASTLVPQHVVDHEDEYVVRCHREGPTAITEVLEHVPTGRVDVLVDGFVAAGSSASAGYMRLMGELPMVLHPHPDRALVICFGTGTTTRAVVEHARASSPPGRVEVVDINPDVFACASESSPDNAEALSFVHAHVDDGRAFLREGSERFDVITQEPMPPHFAGVASLYSVEYYELVRARLEDDGVLVQWLPMHLTAPEDARAIAGAAQAVFPETWLALAPGDYTGLLVMSPTPLSAEARGRVEASLHTEFVLDPAAVARFAAGVPPVTDDRPSLEHNGIDRVLGQYGSAIALLEHNLGLVVEARDGAR